MVNKKKSLRKHIYSLQNSISKKEEIIENENIVSSIKSDANFITAKYVMAFWPMPNEVDLRKLIIKTTDKIWVLPSIENGILVLKIFNGEDNLIVSNHFGILEPNGVAKDIHNIVDYVIVPGVAFNAKGHRIGHGKGYYDNLLPKLVNAQKVGVGFSYQQYENIPIQKTDYILDKVIFGFH